MKKISRRFELKNLLPKKDIIGVEVGVAEGLFSDEMLREWPIKKLYMVDTWQCHPDKKGDISSPQNWHDQNFNNVVSLMQKHKGRYEILRGLSVLMSSQIDDESLDFVYLDAGHDYDSVLSDLQAWYPKLKIGGVMAGHDYLMPQYGVYQAVADFTNSIHHKPILIPEIEQKDAGFYFIK